MSSETFTKHHVEPNFNGVGINANKTGLDLEPTLDIFDAPTRRLLEKKQPFTLVLGAGFEDAETRARFQGYVCRGLASIEQLRFLKDHGLRRIEMGSAHGSLIQNARAVGIDVVIAKQS
jgi:hypothetical protein